MRTLAHTVGVTVSPADENPWDLRVSSEPSDWGVSEAAARERFEQVLAIAAPDIQARLEIRPLNTVAFGLYEDEIIGATAAGAVVGISFDHAHLQNQMGREAPPRRAYHLVRLSPFGTEQEAGPTIMSDSFRFDYAGKILIFDDSQELEGDDAVVCWSALLHASRSISGALWIVRRDGDLHV